MIEPHELLWGGLLPAVVAAGVLATVWKLTLRAGAAWNASLALGFLVGYLALDASKEGLLPALAKSFRPHEARDWLPLILLLSLIPGAISALGKRGWLVAWLLRGTLCLLLPWRLLRGSAYLPTISLPNALFADSSFDVGAWSTGEAAAWLGGIGATLLVVWIVAEAADQSSFWRLRGLLATLVALGGAVTLALSGSFTYGQLLGVLTATLAGSSVAASLLRLERGPETAAGPWVVAFGGTLVLAHFFAELKLLNACLLLLAMVAATGWGPPLPKLSRSARVALRCLLCLASLGIAVTLAAMDFSATQAETESNPYLNFRQ